MLGFPTFLCFPVPAGQWGARGVTGDEIRSLIRDESDEI